MISLTKFEKRYGKKEIIKCDNICFEKGKISFLMAPNGAGKTTLIKCITGLEKYDGEIRINEEINMNRLDECLALWDDCPFYDSLSGFKNLIILSEGRLKRGEIWKVALEYLDADIIKRRVNSYSYGQKKKLALILAKILNPKVLIMDEISNGLDFDTMLELQQRLKELSDDCTIILTGHQFAFYENLYDDLFLIKNGMLVKAEDMDKKSLEEVYCEELH